MNIIVESHNDLQAVSALTRFSMCRKTNPKKRMLLDTLVVLLLLSVAIVGFCMFQSATYLYLILLSVLFSLLQSYMYWGLPRIVYRRMHKFAGIKNVFNFIDDQLCIRSQSDTYTAEETVDYTMLYQTAETKAYFLIYQTKQSVYVVDKSSLTDEQIVQIRGKLQNILGKKYIRCRY